MTSGLSRTTLVIVLVVAALAAILAVVLFIKLIRAQHRRPEPLPPVQPLAHHRFPKYDHLDSRPPSSGPDFPPPNPSFQSFDPPSPTSSISRVGPPRPLSSASLSSAGNISRHTSRATLRGLPHAPSSHVQIILPAPLSATLPRPFSARRDTESDHTSVVDKWVPVGRDDSFPSIPSTPRALRRASASATMSTSSSAYFHHPPPVPQIPKDMISHR